jgi:hypothetical protein
LLEGTRLERVLGSEKGERDGLAGGEDINKTGLRRRGLSLMKLFLTQGATRFGLSSAPGPLSRPNRPPDHHRHHLFIIFVLFSSHFAPFIAAGADPIIG